MVLQTERVCSWRCPHSKAQWTTGIQRRLRKRSATAGTVPYHQCSMGQRQRDTMEKKNGLLPAQCLLSPGWCWTFWASLNSPITYCPQPRRSSQFGHSHHRSPLCINAKCCTLANKTPRFFDHYLLWNMCFGKDKVFISVKSNWRNRR